MGEAVLPLLGYLVLQIIVMITGLNIVREKELNMTAFLKSWIMGQMLLFAVLQIIAVPMILLRWQFNTLFWTYFGIVALLFVFGTRRLTKSKIKILPSKGSFSWLSVVLLVICVLAVLAQSCVYFFGMHIDQDDARWLAEANDALEYGQMMTRSYHTGEFTGHFAEIKDVASPWPMFIAILSRILNTRTAVFSHTIYPAVSIILVYGIYYLIGAELFEKREARYAFLLFAAVITSFFGGSTFTQGAFALVRIWQGKATAAAVVIPFILCLVIRINKTNQISDWLKLAVAGAAACLMSGMGIIISLIMIAIYGLYHLIAYLHWKRIPLYLLSIMPSLICALMYYFLKG